jgi:hypothetical protein
MLPLLFLKTPNPHRLCQWTGTSRDLHSIEDA